MNDFSELEAELKRLCPAPVSAELRARIEVALTQQDATPTAGVLPRPTRRAGLWWSLGLGLTTASALVLVWLAFFAEPPVSAPVIAQANSPAPGAAYDPGLQPSALTQVVYHRRDEGLVFSPNQTERPLRRVRYDTRETMQWRNPQTGA
ncbi:MAG: hypothetical protein H0V54_15855, partial [Chthoniobacterales bacterium]|nr:hypothetical protein [Chthoniobacterales bacterium]